MWVIWAFSFHNETVPHESYTLSLHDALPILAALEALACGTPVVVNAASALPEVIGDAGVAVPGSPDALRSEEHTSELQSRLHLVCRLLLEKKQKSILRRSQTLLVSVAGPIMQ